MRCRLFGSGIMHAMLLASLSLAGDGSRVCGQPVSPAKSEKPLQPARRISETFFRSVRSGPWSQAQTWENGRVPVAGATVQIKAGHRVLFDVKQDEALRVIHVAGVLSFAPDRDTRLSVGLLKIQAGEDATENGFDCDAHIAAPSSESDRPALEVGTPSHPIQPGCSAVVRLVHLPGMDKESCPAVVCCGGRMDFHGSPMNHTWVRLGEPARKGDDRVTLAEPVTGWRMGDRIIVTTSEMPKMFDKGQVVPSVKDSTQTEERRIRAIKGMNLILDEPLAFAHRADGFCRAEVANLSRNVVVESADRTTRGHTMYHRHSAGSISYAEFRHLGKPGVLGRYALHYHLCGDTMRGSSVIGASVWDSGNRWLTVHGTDYLIVRDCVGYDARGHGFFLEDGTEVFNVFDRNLAVQARRGAPLPKQVLPFDRNDGAGFWWANSLNTFTRNVAAECDQYGFRFEAVKDKDFDPVLPVRQPDGSKKRIDVRTLPFVRFEDNETHSQRRFGLNLGGIRGVATQADLRVSEKGDSEEAKGGHVDGVGPDRWHPFIIKNFRVWASSWAFHSGVPSVLIDGLEVTDSNYGIWRTRMELHEYKNISFRNLSVKAIFNPWGGNPDISESYETGLAPRDDLPPTTVITHIDRLETGVLLVRGTTADNGSVKRVTVNGRPARLVRPNFSEWEVLVPAGQDREMTLEAYAEDAMGNIERRPHRRKVD